MILLKSKGEESSYTHCLFNADIGFIGIAKKVSLAPTAESIAGYIEKLLSITKIVLENQITVEIRPIPDPEDFLKKIASAYSVTQFTATFRGPNPFDADAYFQKPLSVYLSAANGETGKAEINGVDLNRDVIQSVTRSTAATGNEATARIKKTSKQKKPNKISLKGDPIKFRFEEEEHSQEALACLTNLYHQVRDDRRD